MKKNKPAKKFLLKHFTMKITWLQGCETGWGNGYVAIPKGHPMFEMGYDEIHNKFSIDIHGGLTYADNSLKGQPEDTVGMWIIGFDCAHYGDNIYTCPKEFCESETLSLLNQVQKCKLL